MSQDEYNMKYKLGKYRPAGNKLAEDSIRILSKNHNEVNH